MLVLGYLTATMSPMNDIIAFIEYVWFPFSMFGFVAYLLWRLLMEA